jgi:cytochrome b
MGRRRVWSPAVRTLHLLLAGSVLGAFFTHEGGGRWHEWLGYVALAAAVARLALGFWPAHGQGRWGPHHRFDDCVRSPRHTWRYAQAVLARREPHHLGHNPLGAWMVVALLACTAAAGFSGWLYTTDRFWGVEWVETLHAVLGKAFVPLVVLHWLGVAHASWRHRENLVAAMVHGHKPGDDGNGNGNGNGV